MIIVSKDKFKEWMKRKGYSEFTPEGLPSTIFQYCYYIERVMERAGIKSWSELTPHLRKIIVCFSDIAKKEEMKYWGTAYPTVINALETFEWYVLELSYQDYKRYLRLFK